MFRDAGALAGPHADADAAADARTDAPANTWAIAGADDCADLRDAVPDGACMCAGATDVAVVSFATQALVNLACHEGNRAQLVREGAVLRIPSEQQVRRVRRVPGFGSLRAGKI